MICIMVPNKAGLVWLGFVSSKLTSKPEFVQPPSWYRPLNPETSVAYLCDAEQTGVNFFCAFRVCSGVCLGVLAWKRSAFSMCLIVKPQCQLLPS